MTSVLDQLACALGRHDEEPNIALARALAGSGDAAGVAAPMNDPAALAALVRARREAIPHPAKRARLDKVLRRLAKL